MKELNDLTDLEICKEIARIEGFEFEEFETYDATNLVFIVVGTNYYDPVENWNITGPLMVKYKVNIEYSKYLSEVRASIRDDNYLYLESHRDTQRAICLAIIAQHRLKGDIE